MSAPQISTPMCLIYLVYNEAAVLEEVLTDALAFCQKEIRDWQIVIVDDGSSDGSKAIAKDFADQHKEVYAVAHTENRGMGAAMATGIQNADRDYLVFLASDGQSPASALLVLAPLLQRADIVLSTYAKGNKDWQRIALSAGLRLYMRMMVGIRFQLEGLYLFPTAMAKSLVGEIRAETFFFSFELVDRAVQRGMTTALVEMEYRQRLGGESKIANWAKIRRVGREVARYALRKREEKRS